MGQKHTLFFSASEGRTEDLRWVLFQKKTSPNLRDHESQEVALHLAAAKGHVPCVKLLLKAGANVDARNNHGLTSLHLAVFDGRFGCVQALIDGGANVNATSRFGCTPLHQACYFGRLKSCQALLKAGALVDVQESWGRTPLFLAVERQNRGLVELLLKYNANVDMTDQIEEQTSLLMAASLCNVSCMSFLLDHNSNPNHQDIFGNTPLHHVTNCIKHNDMVKCFCLLVTYGAMGTIKNSNGETVMDILKKEKDEKFQKLIALTHEPKSLRSLCWVQVRKNLAKSNIVNLEDFDIPCNIVQYIADDLAFLDTS